MLSPTDIPIEEVRNLGPASARWLLAAGIRTRADLERLGSVEAFLRVREAAGDARPSVILLYALEAGLTEIHWTALPDVVKRELKAAAR